MFHFSTLPNIEVIVIKMTDYKPFVGLYNYKNRGDF